MFNRIILLLLLLPLLAQGCASQVLNEHIQKGMLVKEEGTGVVVARSRKAVIELVSPLSVRVSEEVEEQETTKQYYQKVRVRSEATPKKFPWWDAWTKLLLSTTVIPLFLKDFWVAGSFLGPDCRIERKACAVQDVPSVLSREFILEDGTRSTLHRRRIMPQPEGVGLFINGFYKGTLLTNSADVATVELHAYPELAALHKPLKLTFKYRDAYAYSVLPQAEVERLLGQSAPAMNPAGSR